jgi:hypothetical protein
MSNPLLILLLYFREEGEARRICANKAEVSKVNFSSTALSTVLDAYSYLGQLFPNNFEYVLCHSP